MYGFPDTRRSMAEAASLSAEAYFAGVAGCAGIGRAGVAGCDLVWLGLTFCSTDFGPARFDAAIDRVIEVTMKMTADQVVALDNAEAAPRGPNAVWLPIPPKAAAMSPLFPLCNRTTTIMKKQTMMWTIVISVIIQGFSRFLRNYPRQLPKDFI